MRTKPFKPFLWFVSVILLVSMGCTPAAPTAAPQAPPAQEPVAQAPAPTPLPVEEPTPTSPPPPAASSLAVTELSDVELAVVQIEAEGTFVDPEVGWQVNVGSRGTGFIISEDGIAVTNNHVVTGAALLRVYVPGESRPRNARILGVSECSDLAVIDIQGDGFRYLDWNNEQIKVGLDAFAAGFPLGDPEFTLTKGIVSKARADGETGWASVDWVLEHSAKINPGNSGGPLVDQNGRVIGVNYAGVSATDQNFAISREVAIPIIDELRSGKDVDSVGINGTAVYGTVDGIDISGIWVRSVAAGSPADKARILAGDILFQLQGQVLATDGTMADYCDILRTRRPTDTMDIVVIRYDDLSLLEGQLNGRQLETIGFFTGSAEQPGPSTDGDWVNDGCYLNEYGTISCLDNTDSIYVEVPYDWQDYNGGEWVFDNEVIGVAITAAPSVDYFNGYYNEPGLFFGASDTFAKWGGYIQFLDIYSNDYGSGCKLQGRYDYNDGYYRGKYDKFTNCGGAGGSDAYVLSAVSTADQGAYIILLLVQVPKGDTATPEMIFDSFIVGDF
jgi:serine protease Do